MGKFPHAHRYFSMDNNMTKHPQPSSPNASTSEASKWAREKAEEVRRIYCHDWDEYAKAHNLRLVEEALLEALTLGEQRGSASNYEKERLLFLCYRFLTKDASQSKSNRNYLVEGITKVLSLKGRKKA